MRGMRRGRPAAQGAPIWVAAKREASGDGLAGRVVGKTGMQNFEGTPQNVRASAKSAWQPKQLGLSSCLPAACPPGHPVGSAQAAHLRPHLWVAQGALRL